MDTASWNNYANQLNPNNWRYWNSRGLPGRPENWQGQFPKSKSLECVADIGSMYLFTKTLAPCYALSKVVIGGLLSVKGLVVLPPIALGWFLYQRNKGELQARSEDP